MRASTGMGGIGVVRAGTTGSGGSGTVPFTRLRTDAVILASSANDQGTTPPGQVWAPVDSRVAGTQFVLRYTAAGSHFIDALVLNDVRGAQGFFRWAASVNGVLCGRHVMASQQETISVPRLDSNAVILVQPSADASFVYPASTFVWAARDLRDSANNTFDIVSSTNINGAGVSWLVINDVGAQELFIAAG